MQIRQLCTCRLLKSLSSACACHLSTQLRLNSRYAFVLFQQASLRSTKNVFAAHLYINTLRTYNFLAYQQGNLFLCLEKGC